MSRWWRAHEDAIGNPKLQRMPGNLFKSWFNLMCLASRHGGVLPPLADIAFGLRKTDQQASAIIADLRERKLIDEADGVLRPHDWDERQFKTDTKDPTNATRQKRYRQRHATVTDTVTVTDTRAETEQSRAERTADAAPSGAAEPADEDPKAKLFRIGKTTLVSFGVAEKRTGALIGQWLKTADPQGLLAAIEYARDQNVADPVAYISALLTKAKSNGNHGKQDLSAMCTELAGELRKRERAAGAGRSDELF